MHTKLEVKYWSVLESVFSSENHTILFDTYNVALMSRFRKVGETNTTDENNFLNRKPSPNHFMCTHLVNWKLFLSDSVIPEINFWKPFQKHRLLWFLSSVILNLFLYKTDSANDVCIPQTHDLTHTLYQLPRNAQTTYKSYSFLKIYTLSIPKFSNC